MAPAKVFATLAVTVDSDPDTGGLADAVRASASGRSTENGAAGPGAGAEMIPVCAEEPAAAGAAESRSVFISLPRSLIAPDPVGPDLRAVPPPPRLRLAVNSSRHIPLP
ncbi:hypothetical protein BZL30_4008 [Mycobacterium kansasii]|uniref:Uncharacterized protein n=1 Tax=Mycobacterium kansasii TaxID=1768 RepID=A0A1V3XCW5_MYCKA|nr:hypothetical protein BZL30_4008 [Mycobacterium kansasii]